jgi:hypothetical protein
VSEGKAYARARTRKCARTCAGAWMRTFESMMSACERGASMHVVEAAGREHANECASPEALR